MVCGWTKVWCGVYCLSLLTRLHTLVLCVKYSCLLMKEIGVSAHETPISLDIYSNMEFRDQYHRLLHMLIKFVRDVLTTYPFLVDTGCVVRTLERSHWR